MNRVNALEMLLKKGIICEELRPGIEALLNGEYREAWDNFYGLYNIRMTPKKIKGQACYP